MIKNERQYRITKAQAEEFDKSLRALSEAPAPAIHPRIAQAQRDSVRSQLDELREELAAYEALQKGSTRVLEVTSFEELPAALIQARIAAGLTQRELADRLGMKEQQLQRYEATDYAGANLERIQQVVAALGLTVRHDVFFRSADVSIKNVVRRAHSAGLGKDFITKRILPRHARKTKDGADTSALQAAGLLNRIYGWTPPVFFGDVPLAATSGGAMAGARFKLPTNASSRSTEAYAGYAHYIARLFLRATPTLKQGSVPLEPGAARDAIRGVHRDVNFLDALDYVWSLGIPVLPLSDAGAFHGATWRVDGRNVIVLKQRTRLQARWLHDLLHELRHAGEEPDATQLAFVDYEALSKENGSSPAEDAATTFAGDVVLGGRAEELVQQCVTEAGEVVERLKAVVPRVADREGVSVDALANYVAFRLSLQGLSWWGAAANLQKPGADPWLLARDRALSHLDLTSLDQVERSALLRALEDGEASP
jgi:transcriptional regulator with XRE-family HTH domain